MVSEGGEPLDFWSAVVPQLVHDIQVAIAEALDWTEAPLSATDLYFMFNEEHPLPTLSYHLRRLENVRAVSIVHREFKRGRERKWYFLRGREWKAGAAGFQIAA